MPKIAKFKRETRVLAEATLELRNDSESYSIA